MILDKERRFVFTHAPRTGGTSIRSVLGGDPSNSSSSILNNDGKETRKIEEKYLSLPISTLRWSHWSHVSVDIMEKRYWEQYNYIFTCVRNPWERLFSIYKKTSSLDLDGRILNDFEAFVKIIHTNLGNNLSPDFLHITQDHWFSSHHGIQIDTIKFEDLKDKNQWNRLLDKCGIKNECRPHENISQSKQDYRTAYNSSMRDMVAEIESITIDRFNYKF